MLNEVLITAFDLIFDVFHQQVKSRGQIAIPVSFRLMLVEISIAKPVAVTCSLSVCLDDFCTDCNLNLLNSIEHHRTQPSVKTIEVNYIREMDIAPQKPMVGSWIDIVLKWICICAESVITDISPTLTRIQYEVAVR